MKKVFVLSVLIVLSFGFMNTIWAIPLYYAFEGPLRQEWIRPPYAETEQNFYVRESNFGDIYHIILIDRDKPASQTDSNGNITYWYPPYSYYADYVAGSLKMGANTNVISEDNYVYDVDGEYVSGMVSYGDKRLDFFAIMYIAHPDIGIPGWCVGSIYASSYDSGDGWIEITSVSAENPIPEPATMLLLGSGLIGLAGYGRKRFLKSKLNI